MGLRERNAARTRDLILDTALPLFLEQGYEATTMEQIAERAQIGTSTLYRYFPTKDLLVLEPLGLHGQMAAELLARPADEDLDLALGHAVRALLTSPRGDAERLRQVQAVMEDAPSLQTRLLQEFANERTLLERAVAERLDLPEDDVFCVMTARMATTVLELASELSRGRVGAGPDLEVQDVVDRARSITDALRTRPPVLPRLEA